VLEQQLHEHFVPGTPIEIEYQVRRGKPDTEILRAAAEMHADLIVVGNQGRTGIDGLLIGNVADSIMRHAHCPTLSVRLAPPLPDLSVRPIQTILHPTDFSSHAESALRVAKTLAREHGARLIVMHVVPVGRIAGAVQEPLAELDVARAELDWLCRQINDASLKYPVERKLTRGDIASAILDEAETRECDLIVMGTHGRGAVRRLFFGSVAEAVMHKAHCPVLTVKAPKSGDAKPMPEEQTIERTDATLA
jgi:nucleotide-binding universal stress UspA family protein